MSKLHLALAAAATATLLALPHPLLAGGDGGASDGVPPPAWPTSPYHGVISGATGEPIPCRCRYHDSDFRLGDTVCMKTYRGVQLARCDLFLNNTTWVPIGIPCTMSHVPKRLAVADRGPAASSFAAGICSRRPAPRPAPSFSARWPA